MLKGRGNKDFWAEVLQDLVSRGVHRVLLFVTDGFRGLGEVIGIGMGMGMGKLFPYAEHQLVFCTWSGICGGSSPPPGSGRRGTSSGVCATPERVRKGGRTGPVCPAGGAGRGRAA